VFKAVKERVANQARAATVALSIGVLDKKQYNKFDGFYLLLTILP